MKGVVWQQRGVIDKGGTDMEAAKMEALFRSIHVMGNGDGRMLFWGLVGLFGGFAEAWGAQGCPKDRSSKILKIGG